MQQQQQQWSCAAAAAAAAKAADWHERGMEAQAEAFLLAAGAAADKEHACRAAAAAAKAEALQERGMEEEATAVLGAAAADAAAEQADAEQRSAMLLYCRTSSLQQQQQCACVQLVLYAHQLLVEWVDRPRRDIGVCVCVCVR